MARILVVEDDLPTANVIRMNLQRLLPLASEDLQVDLAATVTEARDCLEHAVDEQPYDVIILDFKLPSQRTGDHAEVDESLCLTACRCFPNALVGHITSHVDDRQIKEHIDHIHLERSGGTSGFSLSKNTDYLPQLLANVKQHLFAKPIEQRLNQLFSDTPQDFSAKETDCLTHQLADLKREIMLHWADLEAPLKDCIRQAFKYVETDEDGRLVRLSEL